MKNTKLQRIKETLMNVLSQFSAERITSDRGIIDIQKAGDEIAVGDTVMGVDEEGNEVQIESGDYVLTDGTILRVAEGRIAEIVVPEVEAPEEAPAQEEEPVEEEAPVEEPKEEEVPAEEEAPAEEEEKPAEDEPVEEQPAEEEAPEEEPAQEDEKPAEEPVDDEVARLRAEIAQKDARIAELEARIAELEDEPAAKPATEEFKAVNTIRKTGSDKLDRLAKFMNS